MNHIVRTRKLAYFHFSHYKSIETLRCHSNQSSYLTGIKITNYVEASVRNMYTKYKIHHLTVSEENIFECFLFFFQNFALCGAPATNQNKGLGQNSQETSNTTQ